MAGEFSLFIVFSVEFAYIEYMEPNYNKCYYAVFNAPSHDVCWLPIDDEAINGFRNLLVTVSLFEIIENSRSFCLSNTAVLSIYCFIPTLTIAWGYKVIVKKTCLSS